MTRNLYKGKRQNKKERSRGRARRVRLTPTVLILLCVLIIVTFILSYYGVLPFKIFPSNDDESSTINVELVKSQDLSIHFLELGNKYTGDCTLIKVGNTEVLIDAGSKTSSIPTITNYLNQYVEDNTLEYVIVTHAHEDHYAGFATNENENSLFDYYQVEMLIQFAQITDGKAEQVMYQNYLREVNELIDAGTTVYTAKECVEETDGAQSIYQLNDKIKLEILDQRFYHEVAANENNHSVCCQIIQNDDKYYLFTGDLEKSGEQSLVASNTLHPVELYKAGHHGSKTSSHDVLLEVIKPKNVCVCCCAGSSEYTDTNENQFPTQEFIDRVAPYTSDVFVTTLCLNYKDDKFESMNGNIVVYCNQYDNEATVTCSNNKTILKNTKWFKNNRNLPPAWS